MNCWRRSSTPLVHPQRHKDARHEKGGRNSTTRNGSITSADKTNTRQHKEDEREEETAEEEEEEEEVKAVNSRERRTEAKE